ncbi:MAG: hypothetical protein CTY12_10770, partial [Methylotenera sp.]
MPFIVEQMPEEAKEKLPFNVSTRPDGSKHTLWKWVVDKERDAYLVFARSEGGGYEGTQLTKHYILSWQGHLISI